MINEKDLAKLSYRGAPKIVSEGFPPHNKTILISDEEMDATFNF